MRATLLLCALLSTSACDGGSTRSPEAAAQQRQYAEAAATARAREETECAQPEPKVVSEGRAPMMIHYEVKVDACGKIGTFDVYCSGPDCDAQRQGRWRARTARDIQNQPALPDPEAGSPPEQPPP